MAIDRDTLLRMLRQAREAGATDLHLKVPGRPSMRVNGLLLPLAGERLHPGDTRDAVQALMALAGTELPLSTLTEAEFAFGIPSVGRFRVAVFRQRGSFGVVVHRMATEAPRLVALGVEMPALPPGHLLLVAGARRRDVVAAVVDRLNHERSVHVVLLEEQAEYLHRDQRAAITHREVGIDTANWSSALRSALRQDPDILVVGEVPEPAVAEGVLRALDHGVAVVAGIAAPGAAQALDALVRLFPEARTREVQERFRAVMAGAIGGGPGLTASAAQAA